MKQSRVHTFARWNPWTLWTNIFLHCKHNAPWLTKREIFVYLFAGGGKFSSTIVRVTAWNLKKRGIKGRKCRLCQIGRGQVTERLEKIESPVDRGLTLIPYFARGSRVKDSRWKVADNGWERRRYTIISSRRGEKKRHDARNVSIGR